MHHFLRPSQVPAHTTTYGIDPWHQTLGYSCLLPTHPGLDCGETRAGAMTRQAQSLCSQCTHTARAATASPVSISAHVSASCQCLMSVLPHLTADHRQTVLNPRQDTPSDVIGASEESWRWKTPSKEEDSFDEQ